MSTGPADPDPLIVVRLTVPLGRAPTKQTQPSGISWGLVYHTCMAREAGDSGQDGKLGLRNTSRSKQWYYTVRI